MRTWQEASGSACAYCNAHSTCSVEIRGDVLHNANLGYAIALGMIVITGVSNILYLMLRMRAERWQK